MSTIVIIDAKNFVYRHAHTHKTLSSDGFPTSVLYGCPIGLLSLAKKFPGAPLVFAWDGEGPTWRHHLLSRGNTPKIENKIKDSARIVGTLPPYMQTSMKFIQQSSKVALGRPPIKEPAPAKTKERPVGYKANRDAGRDNWNDAYRQIPIFRKFLTRIGLRQFQVDNLEGDDLIGILVTAIVSLEIFDKVIIHSSDRDFYQFICDEVSVLRSGHEGGFAKPEDIETEFGVTCADYTKLRAIIGDSGDNIPKLFYGVGKKTAAGWLNKGLNPALDNWQQNPLQFREWFTSKYSQKYDLKNRWEDVKKNYIASQIVRRGDSQYLSSRVKQDLAEFLPKLSQGYLTANARHRTEENWRWLSDYLLKYELAELYGRRQELWALP